MAQAEPAPRETSPRTTRRAPVQAPASGPAPTLRILETRVLRGPNYWAREPVIRLLVDLGVLEQYPSNLHPELHRRAGRAAADARGPRLLARSSWRLHHPAA